MKARHPAAPPAPPPPPPPPPGHLGLPAPTWQRGPLSPGELMVGGLLAFCVFSFFLAVFLLQAGESRARKKIKEWALANQFEIIKHAVVQRPRGPFRARPAWQTVSAVTVRTPKGFNRSAWICWGNLFFLYWGTPEVQWDEEAGKRAS